MASIADLKLGNQKIDRDVPLDLANLPEQMGMRPKMLQPGPYVFRLPLLPALRECFDLYDTVIRDKPVKRIAAVFGDGAELTIVQAPDSTRNGTTFRTRINNAERARGKKDDPKTVYAADWDYLLQVLGEPALPGTNQGYGEALMRHPGEQFGADVELNWACNNKKPIRVEAEGSPQLIALDGTNGQPEIKGCGARYYEKDVDRDADGNYPNRISCTCNAVLFANENLTRFRKVKADKPAAAAAAATK